MKSYKQYINEERDPPRTSREKYERVKQILKNIAQKRSSGKDSTRQTSVNRLIGLGNVYRGQMFDEIGRDLNVEDRMKRKPGEQR